MIVLLWEFRVQPGREAEFEAAYGPEGDWARLFGRSPGYRGTELLRDLEDSKRYFTLDRWDDASVFEAFKAEQGADYSLLDRACEPLCVQERFVGRFTDVTPSRA